MSATLEDVRQFYAEEVQVTANLKSEALVRALATVPREVFLGPGPWQVQGFDEMLAGTGAAASYRPTPDANPRHVYHNVAIALDPSRLLNNGHPGTLATWIDRLGIGPGFRVAHVGCGTGYYTAVIAEIVGSAGRVLAFDVDAALAERARANLSSYPHVTVVNGDAHAIDDGPFDAMLVNAGATHPQRAWLDALGDQGKLMLPLTCEFAPGAPGKGGLFLVAREGAGFTARFAGMVMVYSCSGSRDAALNDKLRQNLSRPIWGGVKSLRTDPHDADDTCWLHGDGWCFSTKAVK
jgi:protein-L-isoaspartate(D-aspartate) O-methyltransferase